MTLGLAARSQKSLSRAQPREPRGCSSWPCCSELFNRRSPHPGAAPLSFPGAENKEPLHLAVFRRLYLVARIPFSGFDGRKGTSSMGKMSILEVPSAALGTGSSDCAPPSPVSRDKSVRRFAQDDDFVANWTKNTQTKVARMGVVLGNFMRPSATEAGKCELSRRL